MSLNSLLPLIEKTGSSLSPADFQHIVNVVFHDAEASHYDSMHANMWESLQQQVELLVNDLPLEMFERSDLKLLDIGSGTGLSTEILLNTELGKHISQITMLDTSPKMLELAAKRAENWNKEVSFVNHDINGLNGKFDIIIVCSVLHHIPDLYQFLDQINNLQNTGSILIHLQDPNGDYINDAKYKTRAAEYSQIRKNNPKKSSLVPKSIKKGINKILGRKTYIDRVNDQLLEKKAIKNRMTADEIWSVTDIHVEDLPFSTGSGISIKFIGENLPDYTLLNSRSYGFFGLLKSELTVEYQNKEQELIDKNQLNGRNVSAVWIKR